MAKRQRDRKSINALFKSHNDERKTVKEDGCRQQIDDLHPRQYHEIAKGEIDTHHIQKGILDFDGGAIKNGIG